MVCTFNRTIQTTDVSKDSERLLLRLLGVNDLFVIFVRFKVDVRKATPETLVLEMENCIRSP